MFPWGHKSRVLSHGREVRRKEKNLQAGKWSFLSNGRFERRVALQISCDTQEGKEIKVEFFYQDELLIEPVWIMRMDAVSGMVKQFIATRKYAPSCGRSNFLWEEFPSSNPSFKMQSQFNPLNQYFFYLKTKSTVPFHIVFLFSRNSKKIVTSWMAFIQGHVILHFHDLHFFWGFHLTQYRCMLPLVSCPSSAWLPCVRCCGPSLFLFLRILDSESYEKPNFDIFRCEWLVPKFGLRHCDKVFHKVRRLILPFSSRWYIAKNPDVAVDRRKIAFNRFLKGSSSAD